jgi:hypothetical protein
MLIPALSHIGLPARHVPFGRRPLESGNAFYAHERDIRIE